MQTQRVEQSVAPQLNELAMKSNVAKEILENLSERVRNREFSDIQKMRREMGISNDNPEYLEFWKNLEQLGCGSIIYGKNPNYPRFHWKYSLIDVANEAMKGIKRTRRATVIQARGNTTATSFKLVLIPLRPNFNVEVKIPLELTENESDTLAYALRGLVTNLEKKEI